MELPQLSPPWFYRTLRISTVWKKTVIWICKASLHKDCSGTTNQGPGDGGLWEITGQRISSCWPEPRISHAWQKNTRHEISYSSPPLWSVPTDISCSLLYILLYFPLQMSWQKKCRLDLLLGFRAAAWWGKSHPMQGRDIIISLKMS